MALAVGLAVSMTSLGVVTPAPASADVDSGTVVAWGDDSGMGETRVPPGLSGVTAIAAGGAHSLALMRDGTVVAWGYNKYGQTNVPADLAGVTRIAARWEYSLALKSDGTVVAWGLDDKGQTDVPAGLSGVTAVAAGGQHGLALTQDGTVVAWGDNSSGQASVPAGLSGVTAIAAGGSHSLALKADGTVVAWGDNWAGQATVPAGLSGVTAIASGTMHSMALTQDGTVVAWGHNFFGQSNVPAGLSGVTAIAGGERHGLAIKQDGTVVVWSNDDEGQTNLPTGLSGATAIAAGTVHSMALQGGPVTAAGLPTISGTATVGSTLTAHAGLWGPLPVSLAYQWNRTGAPIPGATSETYQVRTDDAGSTLSVTVTGSRPGFASTSRTSVPTAVVPSPGWTLTGPRPRVSDTTPVVGERLTAIEGTWAPAGVVFAYQWFQGSSAIPGEDGKTFTVRAADLGTTIRVQVTGTKPAYTSLTRTSLATSPVRRGHLSPTPTPTIDDSTPTVDQSLTALPGAWGPEPVTLTYQWYRGSRSGTGHRINGATSATYHVKGADAGYRLRVRVTGSKYAYTSTARTSTPTSAVAKAVFGTIPSPSLSIDGTPRAGKTLVATPGAWVPGAAFTYQWYRGTTRIRHATRATYTLANADLGRQVTVRVRGSRTGYFTETRSSDPTGPVEAGQPRPVTPRLSDTTPQVDDALTITNAVCPATTPTGQSITSTYQWYQGSTVIDGATGAGFTARPADRQHRLAVKVTCTAADYAPRTTASAPTAKVASAGFTGKGIAVITGTPLVGELLTAGEGTWVPTPDSYTYQWYRNGSPVADARTATLTTTRTGIYSVRVTALRSGYRSASTTSAGFPVAG